VNQANSWRCADCTTARRIQSNRRSTHQSGLDEKRSPRRHAADPLPGRPATGPGRSFFQLEPLAYQIVITLGVIAAAWTWAEFHIHHTRIVQRALDKLIPLALSRGQLPRMPHRSAA
jgi:hypothetical protein